MRSRNFWYGARVWKRQPLALVASSTPRSFHASRSSSRSFRIVSAPISSSNILRSSAIGIGSCAASRAVSSTTFTSFGLSMGQLHVDGRERFRLRDLDQAFPDELEHRKERSEEHTSELQSHSDLVCRLLLEKKRKTVRDITPAASMRLTIRGS